MARLNAVLRKLALSLRLKRALSLVWQSAPGWTVLSLVLVVFQAALPLAALYLTKLVVDGVVAGVTSSGQISFSRILFLIGLAALVGLAIAVARSLSALATEAQGQSVTDRMFGVLHEKSVKVDLGYYEDPQYHDTLHRAQLEAPFRPQKLLTSLTQVTQSGATVVGIVLLLATAHWILPVLLFGAVVPAYWVRIRHSDRTYAWQRRRASTQRRALYLDRLLVHEAYAKEVRIYNLGPELIRRFRTLRDRLRKESIELARQRTVGDLLGQTLASLAVFASYAIIAQRTMAGAITIGDLVMYFGAVQRGQSLVQTMFGGLGSLYENNLFLTTLDDFLNLEQRVAEPSRPHPVPRPMRSGFALEAVNFRYPTGTRTLLNDVSMEIQPGEMVALIGANGSGKTTMVKLLCRLYDPTGGRVTLDGIDLGDFATEDLRRQVAVVFQDFVRYQAPARDNIWFGDTAVPLEQVRIEQAATRSGAAPVIERLRHGYETTLGNWFEDGEELSAGEWQKIALARAFHSDAQLLVLDEPTSALDPASEIRVFEMAREIARDCAVLAISHRFATVRMVDRIYVLDDGRITEAGTHDELMRLGGRYADLFHMQARAYRGQA
jgi:ATP-binding cassette subfamily B protein